MLPWELRLTLRTGTVYYFIHRATFSTTPAYCSVAGSVGVLEVALSLPSRFEEDVEIVVVFEVAEGFS